MGAAEGNGFGAMVGAELEKGPGQVPPAGRAGQKQRTDQIQGLGVRLWQEWGKQHGQGNGVSSQGGDRRGRDRAESQTYVSRTVINIGADDRLCLPESGQCISCPGAIGALSRLRSAGGSCVSIVIRVLSGSNAQGKQVTTYKLNWKLIASFGTKSSEVQY